ncbi:hypothetical protein PISMIDRAFT_119924 [Pisolithus microcarpus 441]|uniref:Uncharacterized protein n=1 Tax=Pisolithus microcarpus 441 TaxID=765257 RepID=A0A0C9XKW9_9AGAM|nr:hypothetical protein BKA83DRAFT_119924 [Pisolithus microcarpus]KIK12940.1 hypothetical protein PISMIDRAFT_119924 [Pisolithus microcarpus 441]
MAFQFLAMVDNGAMINAIDTAMYHRVQERMNSLRPSRRMLRMADGSLVPSSGAWSGMLQWGASNTQATFEVFPSQGSWKMLIGKLLLDQLRAIHYYVKDSIQIPNKYGYVKIENCAGRSI